MTFNEFIQNIEEITTKYGFEKYPVDPTVNTHHYYIPVGKTKVSFYFYEVNNANFVLNGCFRGLHEYTSIKGTHVISSNYEDVCCDKFEDLDLTLFENWIKSQMEVVARHNQYLKDKAVKKNLKKASKDFK